MTKKKHRFFWFMVKVQIVLMLLVLAGVGYYYHAGYADEVKQLQAEAKELVVASNEKTFIPSQTSFVYDSDGALISQRRGEKSAQYVEYADIPVNFVIATISVEDKRFYQHEGVDFVAIIRAAKALVENKGEITQGGSTITMQLAKLMYMEADRTWQYKAKQMFLAIEIEKRYSKNKILEYYLNNVYFANGYYGIKTACQGYFNCELEDLSLSQVAFLCAIPNSPSYYDPIVNIENTLDRRDLILRNMYEDGKITEEVYLAALAEEIVLDCPEISGVTYNNYVDTYTYYCATRAMMEIEGFEFKEEFATEQEERVYCEKYDELFASCQKRLYTEGYRIYTSIDLGIQEELQNAIDENLKSFTHKNEDGSYDLQASGVCIDNETGYVVAIVGGRSQDLTAYSLNRAYQSFRQPGSSVKPILVYAPSFERGYTPDSVMVDEEFEGGPKNSGDVYRGKVTLRKAVSSSINTIAWKLYQELTPQAGLSYLKAMHFEGLTDEDVAPATAIGGFTKGMSALEMAAAYATIQNDGLYREPTCIVKIVDNDNNIVYESKQLEIKVYEETAARMTSSCLETVMESGTGKELALENMPCAGKTGTTNSNKDGWFIGYTRYYTTSIWVGCDYPKEVENLKGNTYPGEIWKSFMTKIHEGLAPVSFLPYAQIPEDEVTQWEEENLPKPEEPQEIVEPEESMEEDDYDAPHIFP